MSVEDRVINIRIEQMLTKRGINTNLLTISSTQGDVVIIGVLLPRSHREQDKFSKPLHMKMLDKELRKVPNLKSINWRLANWKKEGSSWKPVHQFIKEAPPQQPEI
ncbi:MAG: hypothetical protein AB1765_04440 [Candidatus Hydrogenedentota bacterium]